MNDLLFCGQVGRVAEAGEVKMLVSGVEWRKPTQMKIFDDGNGNVCSEAIHLRLHHGLSQRRHLSQQSTLQFQAIAAALCKTSAVTAAYN